MLTYQILEDDHIVIIEPKGPLSEADFRDLTADVDFHLTRSGMLRGILIHTKQFPGWENLKAMTGHFRFVHDHHRKIEKVAIVSDSRLAEIAQKLAEHFISAEIRHFAYDERDAALAWLRTRPAQR